MPVPVEAGDSVIEANTFNAGTTIATVADMARRDDVLTLDESLLQFDGDTAFVEVETAVSQVRPQRRMTVIRRPPYTCSRREQRSAMGGASLR